jgi:NADH dehydrogenase
MRYCPAQERNHGTGAGIPESDLMKIPSDSLVTVYGGSGFLGRHVVRALAQRGYRIRVAVRRPDLAFHLQPLGRVGQIHAVQANLRYPDSVEAAAHGASAVVNLVGLLFEGGRQRFDAIHVSGSERVAQAAARHGARMVQISAIGADENATAKYARTKAEAERRVLAALPGAVIVRPSIVFGPEDDFFNRFAGLARMLPALPLIGGGHTKFQPVFVGDVARAIADAVDGKAQAGATYEIGGPTVYSFKELMKFVLTTIGRKRALVPLPFAIAKLEAGLLQFLPKPPLTPDQVELLRTDNVVSEAAIRDNRTLKAFGIVPESIESVVPTYLWRFRKTGQFHGRTA